MKNKLKWIVAVVIALACVVGVAEEDERTCVVAQVSDEVAR